MKKARYTINNEFRMNIENLIFLSSKFKKIKYPLKKILHIEKTCSDKNSSHNPVAFYLVYSLEDLNQFIKIETDDDQ